ncbi:MAG: pentapeptide repeat-containing protein [Bryobacterales bacterium]|nr:pentapeptide repeat-containing protein [Bryobacterales bacterium]MBV9399190.1 pentapeptide repeat-containing protein [Bryobacterales bacterium]
MDIFDRDDKLLYRHPEQSLEGADLTGLCLRRANLSGANLRSLKFRLNYKQETRTWEGDLDEADFSNADLTGARFGSEAALQFADFRGAIMHGVHFGPGCYLKGANFEGAVLADCRFNTVDLSSVNLRNADLSRSTWWLKKQRAERKPPKR